MGLLSESEKRHWKQLVQDLEESLNAEKSRAQRLEAQLLTSFETGIANGTKLHQELQSILEATSHPKAVIFIALDENFGLLKRTWPSNVPDWILFQSTLRIQKVLGPRGRIYHTQQDEFMVLVERFRDPGEVASLAKLLKSRLEKRHLFRGAIITLKVNLGIAFYPEHGNTKAKILRNADIALSEAIKNKSPIQLFTPEQ